MVQRRQSLPRHVHCPSLPTRAASKARLRRQWQVMLEMNQNCKPNNAHNAIKMKLGKKKAATSPKTQRSARESTLSLSLTLDLAAWNQILAPRFDPKVQVKIRQSECIFDSVAPTLKSRHCFSRQEPTLQVLKLQNLLCDWSKTLLHFMRHWGLSQLVWPVVNIKPRNLR